ncbi:MAG TPA: helicase-associated domain-containing protein [Candidatus Hydrogenedentes bacterium]|nr:helicase-associated domain-containing protein [Candidatus Hydrogenedentota bacterium]
MRHGASLITAMEGTSRLAFLIARELSVNSRAGLTVRFLAKKLDLPEEEVEYLVDVNHRLFFIDLTKVKLVAEGFSALKRITDGLENLGDVASIHRQVKSFEPHEFRHFEEQAGIDRPLGKKAAAEHFVDRHYSHPDSVVTYVATRGFSTIARELFDIVWQSKDGVMPVAALRAAHGGSEYEIEQGLWELFRGFALFEMFRFDSEERLARMVGLLAELRQWREAQHAHEGRSAALKPFKSVSVESDTRGIEVSDRVCRLIGAIAARPVRLRGDGDLFREDYRRLSEICPEDSDPSLSTCLWMAQGVGWLARVDSELRAGDLQGLLTMSRVERHRILFDWMVKGGNEAISRRILAALIEESAPGAWYPVVPFVQHAMRVSAKHEQPILKASGAHWHYVSPSTAPTAEKTLIRSLEETFHWFGVVDRSACDDGLFRISELGVCLLTDGDCGRIETKFPARETEIVVQPNFDIVVPSQDTDPLLTVPLDQFAERKSTGGAVVYCLSKESFTRAIQEGHDGDAFVAFLLRHNRGGELPPNVMTTLDDWRGGVKRVRLRTLHVLESDDPLIITDLLHRRWFKKLLQPLEASSMVTYAKINKIDLAKALEKEGFVVD